MTETTPVPPIARVAPQTSVHHGHTLVDSYTWLHDKDNPEVRAYLEAENAFAAAALRHIEPLQEQLFQELRSRIYQAYQWDVLDQAIPRTYGPVVKGEKPALD